MAFPDAERVEGPLLQELRATGGTDQVRYLALRLLRYFPQLLVPAPGDEDPLRARFLRLVRRAARRLAERGEVLREQRTLRLTERGRRRAEAEAMDPAPPAPAAPGAEADTAPASLLQRHREAQRLLVEIGVMLGRHAEAEHDTYDVVWRKGPRSPRLSHVFEVQVRGSVDSALTRLKRAPELQRSRLYLVVSDERSARFAAARLHAAFPELQPLVTLIGLGELHRLHAALSTHRRLLEDLGAE